MSHVKSGGKTAQGSPRPGKRRGVKLFGGQTVKPGMIIIRQKGSKFHPGTGVKVGRDFTIFAMREGVVEFKTRQSKNVVSVV